MKEYAALYRSELLDEVLPFWEQHSLDTVHGGYFSCLTPEGKVYDTDKFMWLQARQAWMFSKLYNSLEAKAGWKAAAKNGIDFLEKYGRDPQGNWYFALDQKGNPLVQPYNIFSDCFAAMAFGEYYKLESDERYAKIANDTFHNILSRQQNPKGNYNKKVSGTRNLQDFALPMILCNLALELEHLLEEGQLDHLTDSIVDLIMNWFYDAETGMVYENISLDGKFVDSFEGRLLNPGHAIEAMWFVMNIGLRKNDPNLVKKAETIMYEQLELGWDKEHGGIFYFMDAKGHPPEKLEWDQKLWWVHLETLVALAKTYAHNQSPKAAAWFHKVHEYAWNHFRDPINGGEWYGYLNRQGQLLLHLKGGKWKGCFHVPRALFEISKTLNI
ncbi:AGE family epimerase/isomerase [Flagellimonas myxillae]|uniref:AGE family epimerase/isomerase n=1 Tax=Flagellimonas myxillae TaxID=2942214 RepID=UPI00201EF09C|nr:AGE family epimerase/isomerase [Muricauda myxillae]MCL6264991.1 AGE family epimerase/isomerase [Muricauda myxillae]